MSLKITFITDESLREVIPEPEPSYSMFPEWFSKLEVKSKSKCPFHFNRDGNVYDLNTTTKDTNVKNCPGIIDYLSTGYIIPSWDNFIFRDNNKSLYGNWTTNFDNQLDSHGIKQFYTMEKFELPNYDRFFKFNTPWYIRTEPGVSCLIMHPYWHRKNNFTTVSGIYHTDKQEIPLKWFFEWNYDIKSGMDLESADIKNQTISKGDPIMLVVPFHRKTYKKEIKYVSDKEIMRLHKKTSGNLQSFKYDDPYRSFRKILPRLFN